MKIKNKILIAGVSTLSVLGASIFAVESFKIRDNQNIRQEHQRTVRDIDKQVWREITTLEELETYLPNISTTGSPLQLYTDSFVGPSFSVLGQFVPSFKPFTSYSLSQQENANKFTVEEMDSGKLTLRWIWPEQPTLGYIDKHDVAPAVQMSGSIKRETKFLLDGDYICVVPMNIDGEWYDIEGEKPVAYPAFPTDAELDTWHFKIKLGKKATISNNKYSYQTMEFDMMEPMWPSPELQPKSFDIFIGDSIIPINKPIDNPGMTTTFKISSDLINNDIEQDVRISFNADEDYTQNDITFKTIKNQTTNSSLTVNNFSNELMKLKIEDFVNGVGWAEADTFEVLVDDIVIGTHNISEFSAGEFMTDIDATGFSVGQEIKIKIKYLKGTEIVDFSNEVTITHSETTPGNFTLVDLYDVSDSNTFGKVRVDLSGETLLPVITNVRTTAKRIDGITEPDTVNIWGLEEPMILELSHPSEYEIIVEYINNTDTTTPIYIDEPIVIGSNKLKTRTGPIVTTLVHANLPAEEVSEFAFNIDGKFNLGSDENGDSLIGETFVLKLNGIVLDSNLLSDDNSNIIGDPTFPEGSFDKSYSGIKLEDFGVIPGVETNLTIELNGVVDPAPAWTSSITFTPKEFKLDTITAELIKDTTTRVSFINLIQGTGIEEATKYTITLYKNSIAVPVQTHEVDYTDGTSEKFHDLINLESGVEYVVKMQFKNSDGTSLLDLEQETTFTTQKNFMLEQGITASGTGDTTAEVSFNGFKQGTGDQTATSYDIELFDGVDSVWGTPNNVVIPTNATSIDVYKITGLEIGKDYRVEVQFKNNTTVLKEFEDTFNTTQIMFGFTGINATNITDDSSDISFLGLEQGSGDQMATSYEVSVTGPKTLPTLEEGEPISEVWDLITVDVLGDIPTSHLLEGLVLASEYTVSVQFKNGVNDLGAKHTNTFKASTPYIHIESEITNYDTVYDSETNKITLTWDYKQGNDQYGRYDVIENMEITIDFHNQVNKKVHTFSTPSDTGTFTIDLNQMITEEKVTQEDIDKGFTVESSAGLIKFENSKFTSSIIKGFLSVLTISLIVMGAFLLIKKVNKGRARWNKS